MDCLRECGVFVIPDFGFHLNGEESERRGEVTEEGEGVETSEYTIEILNQLYGRMWLLPVPPCLEQHLQNAEESAVPI
ncbi:OTU-like cysteine protease [Musa troglodytarum]|uniref:OTU-like cysteine protease n=1 Tax=Musa troglodytarum TaxID=320322 RepID=A0A9E7G8B8_9LILI|nr:OTU-like cysteine protease [Musa troglodytarum]